MVVSLVVLVITFLAGSLFLFSKESSCANSISCIKDLTGEFEEEEKEGVFLGKTVQVLSSIATSQVTPPDLVLGETSLANKEIYIDLTNQRLYGMESDVIVYDFPISSGKWFPTPTGKFRIWIKLRSTRMSGGNPAWGTYYNLPNVPYVMYFYNDEIPKSRGFGIHGAYWHNNFGQPMSHGCVNMRIEDAGKLYHWANPVTAGNQTYATQEDLGTPVIIYGQTPQD